MKHDQGQVVRGKRMALVHVLGSASQYSARVGLVVSCLLIAGVFGIVCLELLARNLFNQSLHMANEFAGYAVAGICFLGLADTLRSNQLIRVNLLLNIGPQSVQKLVALMCLIVSLSVCLFLLWYIGESTVSDFSKGRTSGTMQDIPLWIPKAALLLGLGFLSLELLSAATALLLRKHAENEGKPK